MKIEANHIGNYRPSYVNNNGQNANNVTSTRGKTETSSPVKAAGSENTASITTEEKKYFTNMYPASRQEIADYHYYSRDGKMSGVSVGSLFDRRG